jgi:hypothetical protein
VAAQAKKVLGYFNNHFHGYAPENALQMMEMLGNVTSHSTAALRRLKLRGKERSSPLNRRVWRLGLDRSSKKAWRAYC